MKTKLITTLVLLASLALGQDKTRVVIGTSGTCAKEGDGVVYIEPGGKTSWLIQGFQMSPDKFVQVKSTEKRYRMMYAAKGQIVVKAVYLNSKTNFSDLGEVKSVRHAYKLAE